MQSPRPFLNALIMITRIDYRKATGHTFGIHSKAVY
jgi:hypothetical protein